MEEIRRLWKFSIDGNGKLWKNDEEKGRIENEKGYGMFCFSFFYNYGIYNIYFIFEYFREKTISKHKFYYLFRMDYINFMKQEKK